MSTSTDVRIINGSLEDQNNDVVLRGIVDPATLGYIKVGSYQREVLAAINKGVRKIGRGTKLLAALNRGETLSDIYLSMRGQMYRMSGDDFILKDAIYVVDGLQRITAIMDYIHQHPDRPPPLIGATVYFSKDAAWENHKFHELNMNRIPLSPNIILRNAKERCNGLAALYGLTNSETSFPLFRKISWQQRIMRGEIITASTFTKTALALHQFYGPRPGGAISHLINSIDRVIEEIGLAVFRKNVTTFFNVIDECFGLRNIEFREMAVHIKGNFLLTVAAILSDHENFWNGAKGNELVVDARTRSKLATFNLRDPSVIQLASAGHMALSILYGMIFNHLNRGRSTNKLVLREDNRKNVRRSRAVPDKKAIKRVRDHGLTHIV